MAKDLDSKIVVLYRKVLENVAEAEKIESFSNRNGKSRYLGSFFAQKGYARYGRNAQVSFGKLLRAGRRLRGLGYRAGRKIAVPNPRREVGSGIGSTERRIVGNAEKRKIGKRSRENEDGENERKATHSVLESGKYRAAVYPFGARFTSPYHLQSRKSVVS